MRSLLLAAALLLLAVSPASAATFTPTTGADSGAGSLREALDQANVAVNADEIVLGAGTYVMSRVGNDDTNVDGDFDVTKPVTIRGAGAGVTFIDSDDVDRLFHVLTGASLTLQDLTVTDGNDFGGAMLVDGFPAQGTLERVTVSQFNGASAGIVGQKEGTLTVRDSLFEDNDGGNYGGIYLQGSIVASIADSTFRGNDVGQSGGGIFSTEAARLSVTRSRFDDNFADFGGGALWIQGTNVATVTDSVFVGNQANDFGGGALWTQDTADVTVERTLFTQNFTSPSAIGGGATWSQAGSALKILDSTITGNTAVGGGSGGGGGVYSQANARVTLERTTVSGNRAQAVGAPNALFGGGAAYATSTSVLTLINSTIDGNRSDGGGGAIFLRTQGAVDATNTTISGNTATTGGAISNQGNPAGGTVVARLENSIVAGNTAPSCVNGPTAGVVLSEGRNVEDGDTCGAAAAGDRRNADARLGPLQDNGGPTQTRALLDGSAALNFIPAASCPPVDQRSIVRPQEGACDAGAFERVGPTPVAQPGPGPVVVVNPPVVPPRIVPPIRLAELKASQVLSLPSTRRCVSRRNFRIRLKTPRGVAITRVVVKVGSKRVRTVRGRRITAPVNLRGLPRGRFTVTIELTTADGRKVTAKRRYRTCTPKRRRRG